MRHPPAASPRTAPAPPPPPALAAAEKAERAPTERAEDAIAVRWAAGPAGRRAPGTAATFVMTANERRVPRCGLAANWAPVSRIGASRTRASRWAILPGPGSSHPQPRPSSVTRLGHLPSPDARDVWPLQVANRTRVRLRVCANGETEAK